ncbi:MAG: hypothetical protein JXR37_01930 [Kiritimatiellae bacterium]|nr:hypothetical protein [Kiritimatiellia bacterium]
MRVRSVWAGAVAVLVTSAAPGDDVVPDRTRGAPESRTAQNPLKDPLTGMGAVEREVYQRVYKGKTGEQSAKLRLMPLEELIEKTRFAEWEIDPAEFGRDLDRKRRDLAAMREKYFARLTRSAQDEARIARAAQLRSDLKALASFWKRDQWPELLDLWQVNLLGPHSADGRSVAVFLDDIEELVTGGLREELKKPAFPHSCFGKARSASEMYLTAEAHLHAHPDVEQKEPAAFRTLQAVMRLLKDVTYQAWTFPDGAGSAWPHNANGDMRRKKPMQTATFRYHGAYTVGNFAGYRPLLPCAMVFNDTRMLDIIKDVTEKSMTTRSGYHNQGDCFWLDGIKSDHTFFAHGDQNYIFGYGQDYARGIVSLGERLRGTCWEVAPRKWDGLADVFLDGYQWYVHQGRAEITVMGRHSLYAPSSGKYPSETWGKRYLVEGGWFRLHPRIVALSGGRLARQAEFDAMAERMKANEDLIGNRYFWLSEDLLHHRKDQYVCVNMSSVRVAGPESADDCTLYNRLFGCGMTVLKREGGDLDHIRGAWDYAALPGITFAQGDSYVHPSGWNKFFGRNIYSGGVSDGRNGLCAFKYRQKGVSLAINKAYFAFDDRLVCLGSALANPEGKEAWTTVNQCPAKTEVRLCGHGAERTFPRGEPVTLHEKSDRPISVWHDRMGYVVYPHNGEAEILLKVENRMTQWRQLSKRLNKGVAEYPVAVFRVSVLHDPGRKTPNQGYRYAVLFNVSAEELSRPAGGDATEILQNDARVQAVACGGYTGLVFLEEGAFRSKRLEVAVDRPAILMLDESEPGAVKLTYADPLLDPAARELVVRTNLRLAGPAARGGVLRLPLPGIPEVGKPATVTLALRTTR